MSKIDFIKGHMGGNEIILLYGDQIQKGKEVEVALQALEPPNIGGDQAGLFYKGTDGTGLKVVIVDSASKGIISMCGGLTQVLGKAVIETDFAEYFNLQVEEPIMGICLEMDVGRLSLAIESSKNKFDRVLANMESFVNECYEIRLQRIKVAGINAMKVGKFLVVKGDEITKSYPKAKLTKLSDPVIRRTLIAMQEDFDQRGYLEQKNTDFAIYDLNPGRIANSGRVVFPHKISTGHIEPACGTGTVAVGIAMVEGGEIERDSDEIELSFESGGSPSTIGGPDITKLRLKVKDGKVIEAYFTHSVVEILATGKLWV